MHRVYRYMENGHARWGWGGGGDQWKKLHGRMDMLITGALCLEKALK